MQLLLEKLSLYPKVVVELGMGDGRLIESLSKSDAHSLWVGIELDREKCKEAEPKLQLDNVVIINSAFEEILPRLPDDSIDRFVAVLPDPKYIDENKADSWKSLYRLVLEKLKRNGKFQLVTEITDELLQPVSNERYSSWVRSLVAVFISIGFSTADLLEGVPAGYSTRCLDQFKGDPERIRLVTIELIKP
jgi:hypothetical protein